VLYYKHKSFPVWGARKGFNIMNIAAEILVVILSIFLAIFLILGTILTIYLISLTRQIRKITTSAERTVGNFESIVSRFTKVTSPLFVVETISRFFKKIKKDKEEK
jgi:hypothetical protein